jgi:hypothetical protein
MAKAYRIGQTELYMKEIGLMGKHKEKEYLSMQMEMFIRESFIKIKQTVMVDLFIQMDKSTKDIGEMIFSMVKV